MIAACDISDFALYIDNKAVAAAEAGVYRRCECFWLSIEVDKGY